jgi:hypothetical protein
MWCEKVYEAFGVRPDQPTLRESGSADAVELPWDEITEGVSVLSIQITNYGDAPGQPFVRVVATSPERALEVYRAAFALDSARLFEPSTTEKVKP